MGVLTEIFCKVSEESIILFDDMPKIMYQALHLKIVQHEVIEKISLLSNNSISFMPMLTNFASNYFWRTCTRLIFKRPIFQKKGTDCTWLQQDHEDGKWVHKSEKYWLSKKKMQQS